VHQKEFRFCRGRVHTTMESSAKDDTPVSKSYSRKRSVSGTLFSKSILKYCVCPVFIIKCILYIKVMYAHLTYLISLHNNRLG